MKLNHAGLFNMYISQFSHLLAQRQRLLLFKPPPTFHSQRLNTLSIRNISFWKSSKRAPDVTNPSSDAPVLYQKTEEKTSLITRLWTSIKRATKIEEGDPDKQVIEYFQYSVERLMMHPGEFTYGKFAMYLEDICKKLKLIGKRTIPDDDLSAALKQLRLQYEMMKFLTPRERGSDSPTVFSHQAKQLIAESAKCTLKDVEDMLHHHDVCKTDRTWYFRRLALGRHLPTSYEEREHLSYQRPIAREASKLFPRSTSLEATKIRDLRDKIHYKKPPKRTWPWFRHPTSGKNPWTTREYTKRKLH